MAKRHQLLASSLRGAILPRIRTWPEERNSTGVLGRVCATAHPWGPRHDVPDVDGVRDHVRLRHELRVPQRPRPSWDTRPQLASHAWKRV